MHYRSLAELQAQFDRLFREARAWHASPAASPGFAPPADISEDDDAYYVRLDIPGVALDQLRLVAEDGALIVRGTRPAPGGEGAAVVRAERRHGPLARMLPLPADADFSQVTATLNQGVLQVRVARRRAVPGRRIEITPG